MRNTRGIGEHTEAVILARLLQMGYAVSIPFGGSQKYDLIIDLEGNLVRVQCKTGRFRNGCIHFNAYSVNGTSRKMVGYKGKIDVFIVYCPETNGLYQVPVDEVPEGGVGLRIGPPKNNQAAKMRWAKDYEIVPR